jgi:hypothetical protein
MPSEIRATVEFAAAEVCRLAELSARGPTVEDVSTSVSAGETPSVTEFSTDAPVDPGEDIQRVFSHGTTHRYRFTHDGGVDCPCECLGQFGCPVARYAAREGTLRLVFHAADYQHLRDIVGELRSRFRSVDLTRVIQSPADEGTADSVIVERGKLTPRQLEVLETAYEMGYFERPREANASDVAAELGVDPSTFSEHLAAVEAKVFGDVLER